MKVRQMLATVLSALIKIAIAIWVVNFIYTKSVAAYEFGFRVFTEEAVSPAPGREVSFSYTEGKSDKDLAKSLFDKGLVRDEKLAYVQLLVAENKKSMVPGIYTLTTAMTVEEMVNAMCPEEVEEDE